VLDDNRCSPSKTDIALKLDAALPRAAKLLAAGQGPSISAMLAGHLEQIVRKRKV
jgi:hypothetical protein